MLGFITRRTLLAIPVLIGIVVVVFFLIRAIPGDPCTSLLGERATVEACERFDEANGLNDPIFVQLGIYMKNVVTFNLGESIRFSRPVNQMLIERLPLTTELAVSALICVSLRGRPERHDIPVTPVRPIVGRRLPDPLLRGVGLGV
jgi:peptide/nickel transport system permease protein